MAPVNRGAAVAIAFVVMFQQPLMELIEAGGEIQTRYGLSILPGLAILCIVLLGQHLMQRVAEASKQRQRVETGRLVRMGESRPVGSSGWVRRWPTPSRWTSSAHY